MGEDSHYAIKFIFQDTLTTGVKTVWESFQQTNTMSVVLQDKGIKSE